MKDRPKYKAKEIQDIIQNYCLQQIKSGIKVLPNASLRGVQLDSLQLWAGIFKGGNFSYSRILNSNFVISNLIYTNFQGADLQHCDFQGADMRQANFRYADLRHTNLKDTVTLGAKFHGAHVTDQGYKQLLLGSRHYKHHNGIIFFTPNGENITKNNEELFYLSDTEDYWTQNIKIHIQHNTHALMYLHTGIRRLMEDEINTIVSSIKAKSNNNNKLAATTLQSELYTAMLDTEKKVLSLTKDMNNEEILQDVVSSYTGISLFMESWWNTNHALAKDNYRIMSVLCAMNGLLTTIGAGHPFALRAYQ